MVEHDASPVPARLAARPGRGGRRAIGGLLTCFAIAAGASGRGFQKELAAFQEEGEGLPDSRLQPLLGCGQEYVRGLQDGISYE